MKFLFMYSEFEKEKWLEKTFEGTKEEFENIIENRIILNIDIIEMELLF